MVYCAGLENRRTARSRGSESLAFRQNNTSMKSKIIFLDCDGVLNRACMGGDMRYFDPECFTAFRSIVERTGAKVVLSSSWREFPDWYDMLHDFFAVLEIDLIGKTDILNTGIREDEIGNYLLEHRKDIWEYVVIDDWDMREAFPGHFVHTCARGRIGLDKAWADEAVAILNHTGTNTDGGKHDS